MSIAAKAVWVPVLHWVRLNFFACASVFSKHSLHLVVVHGVGLPFWVIALVQALLLHKITDVDVFEGDGRLADKKLGCGGFSGARRAAEDDDGRGAVCSVVLWHHSTKELRARGCRG
jgi:hypothetical protein